VQVVDVGIDADPLPGLINLKVARGSANIARTAAMSRQQAETVLLASMHLTRQLAADGVKVLASANWEWPIPPRPQRRSVS
jgi:nicotinate-nucleotide--dimethylbenzimidazole phosphoribosyltransferase